MDRYRLTPTQIEHLRVPLDPTDSLAVEAVRETLEDAFIGSTEYTALMDATRVVHADGGWEEFYSDLPSIALELLMTHVRISPLEADGPHLRQIIYAVLPQQPWFDGYEREDLLAFEAFWAWMHRIFHRANVEACTRVCARALVDFDAGGLRRSVRLPRAG